MLSQTYGFDEWSEMKTKYLLGWNRELEEKYSDMITGGKVSVAKY